MPHLSERITELEATVQRLRNQRKELRIEQAFLKNLFLTEQAKAAVVDHQAREAYGYYDKAMRILRQEPQKAEEFATAWDDGLFYETLDKEEDI